MQSVWLVHDIDAFADGQPSKQDRRLDIRMTYTEWLAIYFDALSLDKTIYDRWIQNGRDSAGESPTEIVTEFDEVIQGFPMPSRINEPYRDVVFKVHEIEDLRQECLRVKASSSNELASLGLEKLLMICKQAGDLRLTIYFMSQ
jgi:hypothetical protein